MYPPVPYPTIASPATPASPSNTKASSPSLDETPSSPPTSHCSSSPPLATPARLFRTFVFPRPSLKPLVPPVPPRSSTKSDFFLQLERTKTIESPPSSSPSKQGSFGKYRPLKKVIKRERDVGKEAKGEGEHEDQEVRELLERRKRMKLEEKAKDAAGNDAQGLGTQENDDESSSAHQRNKEDPNKTISRSSPSLDSSSNPLPSQAPFHHPRITNEAVSAHHKVRVEKGKSGRDEKEQEEESSEDELMIALDELITGTKKRQRNEKDEGD